MTTSEIQLERELIEKLQGLKYTYRPEIRDRASLEANFRQKFEALNGVTLLDSEFERLLEEIVSPDVYTAARRLREKSTFTRADETPLHYTLVNIRDWCKNSFEVVNQLRINTANSHHRYDVLLLINGIPAVQIELKTLDINTRRAMEQIVDYKNDPGNGYTRTLLCFLQLFIVSNRSDTFYFANNSSRHFSFNAEERFLPIYRLADERNKPVSDLHKFADRFLLKCTLGQMISRYMVLVASEQKLVMMRPYQIYAVQAIVDCIHEDRGNGYIWHTTGSGKTLTSFKASTLLKDNPDIEKCLFVVDRKDLDRQTREEFNKFQEGCVEQNTDTDALVRRLLSDDYADKVIVTTIQKLGLALDGTHRKNYKARLEPLRQKRMVFIFDECHRSQFGENHKAIKEFFPRAQLFGFTGTPIFEENATYQQYEGQEGTYRTTQDLFQKQLHAYTITHAIDDGNVLRFHVDYYKPEGNNAPKKGEAPDKRAVLEAILAKHDGATGDRKFNAILATGSINDAIAYYELFRDVQAEKSQADPEYRPLKVACVFSPPAQGNKDAAQLQEDLPQEQEDNKVDPEGKKARLEQIIADYNAQYGTNHSLTFFDLYYQDVQTRIKDQQFPNQDMPRKGEEKIDITIVVDMLLTGFDSKYLNTLYVDKNLKHHGLIQAFSRTNRVLNHTKPYGNILDFRQQDKAVDDAIALFSGERGDRARKIWLVDPAPTVIRDLGAAVAKLERFMESQGLECEPAEVLSLKGDDARAGFIKCFKEVQRLKTQLDQYTDLTEEDRAAIADILPAHEAQAFRGVYLETAQRLREQRGQGSGTASPEVEELDFEFVLFASALIDYDYIMRLIARYSSQPLARQRAGRDQIVGMIRADAKFADDGDSIVEYIDTLQPGEARTEEEIREGYRVFKERKEAGELVAIAERHRLDLAPLKAFTDAILLRGVFDAEQLIDLMAPLGLGWKDRARAEVALMDDLAPLLRKRSGDREISGLRAYEG